MTSKLPNLLPLEGYIARESFLRDFVATAFLYGLLMSTIRLAGLASGGPFGLAFKTLFFSLVMTPIFRSQDRSRWEKLFFESGGDKLRDAPVKGWAYQLVAREGILFFSADRLHFAAFRSFLRRRPSVDIALQDGVSAIRLGSKPRHWLRSGIFAHDWDAIEIRSTNLRLIVHVPDATEAVAQIGRAVETLSSRPH